MPSEYLPLFVFALLATLFPTLALLLARLVRPSALNAVKLSAYECGIEPVTQARGRYSVRFVLVAILFVIFDVETILLFPWAVRYRQMGWFGVAEVGVFLGFLVVGYFWAVRKRVLDWK